MGDRTWGIGLRTVKLNLWTAGTALLGFGCGGDNVTAPTSGSLEITTATSGPEPDPDGYAVTIDAGAEASIALNGTHLREDMPPGNHSVQLVGLAANCTVAGDNPRSVSISAGATATVAFSITCGSTTGGLKISVSTSGPSPDPDGYTITLDGTEQGSLASSAEVTLTGLTPGDHQVGLSGIAGNCQAQADNPRNVAVTAGNIGTATFVISCVPPPSSAGSLRITTATTGASPDPDGYSFALDEGASQSIGVNGAVTLPNVATGGHLVRLSGIADNCSVQGSNPRTVTIMAGLLGSVDFSVSCPTASTTYRMIDLGTLLSQLGDDANIESEAYDISPTGQVVGRSDAPNLLNNPDWHAFLWEKGLMKDLGTFGGPTSAALGINGKGQVVGRSDTENGATHAFLWQNGVMTDLSTSAPGFYRADDINDASQVVGTAFGESGEHAVLWASGVATDLGTLGGPFSRAYAINNVGDVVGLSETADGEEHAFLWSKGVMKDLGTPGQKSVAYDINGAGEVVGGSDQGAFLWANGIRTILTSPGVEFPEDAFSINDAGQVAVGLMVWEKGTVTFLEPLEGRGVLVSAINAAGDVVGSSLAPGGTGRLHATLWRRE